MTELQLALLTAHLAKPGKLLKDYRLLLEANSPFAILQKWFGFQLTEYRKTAGEVYKHHAQKGIFTLFITDPNYPELLTHLAYPPPVLFYKGNPELLTRLTISLVGTRQPSLAGLKFTEAISQYLAKRFIAIVSGMARGIDSRAHRSALAAGGNTIGVVAHGLDRIYPAEQHDLFSLAGKSGQILLLSEYPAGTPPLKHHFVKRNRIIAGLSQSLIMAEGSLKSGAMISARHAIDNHRTVFAIDHPAMTANSGGKQLIAQGAENLAERFELQEITLAETLTLPETLTPFYLGGNRWATITPKQQELF